MVSRWLRWNSPMFWGFALAGLGASFAACQFQPGRQSALRTGRTSSGVGSREQGGQLERILARSPLERYAGWMHKLPQSGNDNVLAESKVTFSPELLSEVLHELSRTLPSLSFVSSAEGGDPKSKLEELLEPLRSGRSDGKQSSRLAETLSALPPAEQAQTLLEFLANAPQQDPALRDLRSASIVALGQSLSSNEFTVQTLNLVARGVNLSSAEGAAVSHDVLRAHVAIRDIMSRLKRNYIAPFQAQGHRFAKETASFAQELPKAKILSMKAVGGNVGVNDSLIVTFAFPDGAQKKFLFKSALGSKAFADKYYEKNPNDFLNFINFTRESRAANFYHLILDEIPSDDLRGADLFVPPTLEVALYHEGVSYGLGSLQSFVDPGFVDIVEHQGRYPEEWKANIKNSHTWQDLVVVIKVLDYTFGNVDRLIVPGVKVDYDKNLMVKFAEPESVRPWAPLGVALIDNGLGLPGRDWYTIDKVVAARHFPAALKESLKKQHTKVDAVLADEVEYFVDWGLRDFAKRYDQVIRRIEN